jgi:hypothetical protein
VFSVDTGPNQLRALNLINECALYNHVFTLSPRDSSTDTTVFSKKTKPFIIEGSGSPPHTPSESVIAGNLVTSLLHHPIAERLHLATLHTSFPWLIAGLAPWRGVLHPNPPKREPRYIASLITKHELTYGDDVRGIIEDVFERGKMDRVKTVVHQNEQLLKSDAGTTIPTFVVALTDSPFDSGVGATLARCHIHTLTLRIDTAFSCRYG